MPNPIVNYYRTSDDRFVQLMMLQGDRFWPEVCQLIERLSPPEQRLLATVTEQDAVVALAGADGERSGGER